MSVIRASRPKAFQGAPAAGRGVVCAALAIALSVCAADAAAAATGSLSADARYVVEWVTRSRDNGNAGFIVIDKKQARLHVFDRSARLRASTPVLLGAALGDDSVPGIGSRPIALIRPEERTTPAGRFLGERGHDVSGVDVVWVDYDASVSMHRVITSSPKERRLERLETQTAADNRISWGCINVPTGFYDSFVRPLFAVDRAPVYVLPEVKPVRQLFKP